MWFKYGLKAQKLLAQGAWSKRKRLRVYTLPFIVKVLTFAP